MSTLGTGITQSVAGLNQAQRVVAKDKEKADNAKPSARRVRADRPDEVVVHVETTEAVRSLKENTHEETREDHEQHPAQDQAENRPDRRRHAPGPPAGDGVQRSSERAPDPTPDVPSEIKHIDLEG